MENYLKKGCEILCYPLTIGSTYLESLRWVDLNNVNHTLWFFTCILLGGAISSMVLIFSLSIQLRIAHYLKNEDIPFRKTVGIGLMAYGLLVIYSFFTTPVAFTSNLITALSFITIGYMVRYHDTLPKYLRMSGGLVEWGYKEL